MEIIALLEGHSIHSFYWLGFRESVSRMTDQLLLGQPLKIVKSIAPFFLESLGGSNFGLPKPKKKRDYLPLFLGVALDPGNVAP